MPEPATQKQVALVSIGLLLIMIYLSIIHFGYLRPAWKAVQRIEQKVEKCK